VNSPEHEQACMQIILHAGNGRAEAFAALEAAKKGDFDGAAQALGRADAELKQAHDAQTALLTAEARGAGAPTTMLLAHALDILMAAMIEHGLIEQMVDLHRRLHEAGHGQAADRQCR
jgi:PTS system cellobiose-specific IIA component